MLAGTAASGSTAAQRADMPDISAGSASEASTSGSTSPSAYGAMTFEDFLALSKYKQNKRDTGVTIRRRMVFHKWKRMLLLRKKKRIVLARLFPIFNAEILKIVISFL